MAESMTALEPNNYHGMVNWIGGGQHSDPSVHIRIIMPEYPDIQMVLPFRSEETVWVVKQKVLENVKKELKDPMNYGLYWPPTNCRAGKFLDEERMLRDYPLSGPIGLLEFKYKTRVKFSSDMNTLKSRKLKTLTNQKEFLDFVRKSDIEKITKLTNKGFDPNFNNVAEGETPLTLSVKQQRPRALIIALVSGGACLDYRNSVGQTAMHVAASVESKDAVQTLLDLGSSANYKDAKGLTPLYYCVLSNNEAVCMQMLLHERAEIGTRDIQGWTELHYACKNGRVQHIERLIFYGADMNCLTNENDTPLHICARYNQTECARNLLFRGADKTLKNNANHDAAEVAAVAGNTILENMIRSEQEVVLYTELPKYNDKRRGTISAATIRNLARSRSNPNLQLLFPQDSSFATMSVASSNNNYVANGFVPRNSSRSPPHRISTLDVDWHTATQVETHSSTALPNSSRLSLERVFHLQKENTGFGFTLRGPQTKAGSAVNFFPTVDIPARQYIGEVDPGLPAEVAGLRTGDFLLEINGTRVAEDSHENCVHMMKKSGNALMLKIARFQQPKENGILPHANGSIPNRNTSDIYSKVSKLQKNGMESSDSNTVLEGLDALETLDKMLDSNQDPSPPLVRRDNVSIQQNNFEDNDSTNDHKVNRSDHIVANGFTNNVISEPEPDYEEPPSRHSDSSPASNKRESIVTPAIKPAVTPPKRDSRTIVVSKSEQSAMPAPPPPPPPPPPPSQPGSTGTIRHAPVNTDGTGQATLPPQVKKQLEEDKARSDYTEALLAAVMKRRNVVESVDGEQLSKSIENQVQRTKKLQIVYRGGENTSKEIKSPTVVSPIGLLSPAPAPAYSAQTLPHPQKSNGISIVNGIQNESSTKNEQSKDDGFLAEAERVRQNFLQKKMASSVPEPEVKKQVETTVESEKSVGSLTNADVQPDTKRLDFPGFKVSIPAAEKSTTDTAGRARSVMQPTSSAPTETSIANLALIIAERAAQRQKSAELATQNGAQSQAPPASTAANEDSGSKFSADRRSVFQANTSNSSSVFPAKVGASRVYASGTLKKNDASITAVPPPSSPSIPPPSISAVTSTSPKITASPTAKENIVRPFSVQSTTNTQSTYKRGETKPAPNPPQRSTGLPEKSNAVQKRVEIKPAVEAMSFIPPPVEFASPTEAEPSFTKETYATGTLKSVSQRNQSNSMVFRAKSIILSPDLTPAAGSKSQEKSLPSWTVTEVGEWLEGLDLGDYREIFLQNNIDGRKLSSMKQDNFEPLGVTILHRIKLEKEIRKIVNKKA